MRDDEEPGFEALAGMPPEMAAAVRRFLDDASRPIRPGDPRRHHYLPQFYLRQFANSNEQVAIVRLIKPHKPIVVNVEKAAVIKDFYTVADGSTDTVVVEKVLCLVDGEAHPAIERLVCGLFFPPSPADRFHLALWLGLQYVRDPQTRRQTEAMVDMLAKMQMPNVVNEDRARRYLRDQRDAEPNEAEVTALVEAANDVGSWEARIPQNNLVKLMLESALQIAPHVWQRYWGVIKFPNPGLVTCDRPMVLYQRPENRRPFVGVGIATADEICFPLDRRTVLVLHTDPGIGDRVSSASDEVMADFNLMLVQNAYQEVYCHPDDVAAVQGLKLPSPDRPLVHVEGGAWGQRPYPDGVNAPAGRKGARRYRKSGDVEPMRPDTG